MDAIILCRISDLKQDDGYSLDAQERFGSEYCKKQHYSVRQIFRFVETGSKSHKREKFDTMMDYIRGFFENHKNKMLNLIVEKPDRLTRNFTNREQLQQFVMSGRLVIHYYKDRRILDKNCSPADIFTDDMMTSVSKYIALNIARETRKGMNEKARNGWFPGHAPMGYKNVREGVENKHGRKEAKIVIDPETNKAVLRIFELRGLFGYSYWGIRDQILKENLLPEKKAKRFAKTSVEAILQNPFYEGRFFWDGEWYQGKHEHFVPLEWIRMSQGRRGTSHKQSFIGSFSHLMTCSDPSCGSSIIYDPKTKVNKTTGDTRLYHYYHCADGKRFHKLNNQRQINVAESQIWRQMQELVTNIHLQEPMADQIMEHLVESNRQAKNSTNEIKQNSQVRIRQLIQKEDELFGLWSESLLTKDGYKKQLERIVQERNELEQKIESLENADNAQIEDRAKILLELCKRAESAWNKGSESERLALVKRVCSNFRLSGASIEFDLKIPFLKVLEFKKKADISEWCPGPELNRHARLTEAQDFKSSLAKMISVRNN